MTSAAPLADLADFSDRLSPMVVKELRQGLRTRMFRAVLLILHLLLIAITLISAMAKNPDEVRWLLDGLSILALCVALPLCGFSALAAEIKAKTLEMLVLTRLSAVRIVIGKWASLAVQLSLVAVSLMPYYVARYVYGGANLLSELASLGGQWLAGLVITAGIVCLSTQKQFWLRAVVVGLMLLGPGMAGIAFLMLRTAFRSMGGGPSFSPGLSALIAFPIWAIILSVVSAAAWMIFYFLTLAATRIAPLASHLAVVKRTVHAAVVLVLALIAWWFPMAREGLFMAAAMVVSFASIDALIELRNEVPSLLIPFYRRGLPGRVLAWVMMPGWPNGVFFSVALAVPLALAAFVLGSLEVASRVWLTIAETWCVALILHVSGARHWRDLLGPYIGISIFVSIIEMLVAMVSMPLIMRGDSVWIGLLLPGTVEGAVMMATASGMAATAGVTPASAESLRLLGTAISCVWPLLLIVVASFALRRTRAVRVEGRALAAAA